MGNRFFTWIDFNSKFGKEMASAVSVYERRKESGMADYSLATYDFVFISDAKEKLIALGAFLSNNYEYKINVPVRRDDHWELTGDATEFPVDENNLMYWGLGLYCKGYEFDCKLDGYGAMGDACNQTFPDIETKDDDYYFERAMECYNKGNLGMAIIHFSTAIRINPNDPNSWYSRATVKDQLHTWKTARRDYDKAIELAPDFTDAILNRGVNKDNAGEYSEAIADYTQVIALEPGNEMAYFNRGNSKLNLKNSKGACEDWQKAKELGATYAQERIEQHCSQKSILKKARELFKR
ncbi:tetratricopeptide repeat protein [Mucilaginibacter sp. Mucisp86]|uniref:tetratricopeptide repeat protein n=1 Tax=Mucilaginibacter sp. Mucisp86 TaxID=3243060 RepID=UPI0039B45051